MASAHDVTHDFNLWATTAARVRLCSPSDKAAILHELGIGPIWETANEAWSARLNADIAAERMELPDRYAALCRAEMARRDAAEAPKQHGTSAMRAVDAPTRTGDFRDELRSPKVHEPTPGPDTVDIPRDVAVVTGSAVAATKVVNWSVAEYAALVFALERSPGAEHAAWVSHGVSDVEEQGRVVKAWRERLGNNPAEQAELDRVMVELRAKSS